jgi:hypothetical protein
MGGPVLRSYGSVSCRRPRGLESGAPTVIWLATGPALPATAELMRPLLTKACACGELAITSNNDEDQDALTTCARGLSEALEVLP